MGQGYAIREAAARRHRVVHVAACRELGVDRATFFRVTKRAHGWLAPYPGVRIAPGGAPDARTWLRAAADAFGAPSAAAGRAAAWLHGIHRAPRIPEIVVPHGSWYRHAKHVEARGARWLTDEDVEEVDGIPTLRVEALAITAARWSERDIRAFLIDALHRGLTDLDRVDARLASVGPYPGLGVVRAVVDDLAARWVESIFHDEVHTELDERGYEPGRGGQRLDTPDGVGVVPDIPLPWHVSVEPEGDRFHRTRQQRRNDRRRIAQYAGTSWVPVPVDFRDWQLERSRVMAAIDAAILSQHAAGFGREVPLPPHLRR